MGLAVPRAQRQGGLLDMLNLLALVTDAFGGRGGIAQYNRDLLGALAGSGAVSIRVLPRLAPDLQMTPLGVHQERARLNRGFYIVSALWLALTERTDIVFCGHISMAPLCAFIARLTRARLVVQMHGIEAWQRPSKLHRAAVETADLVLCVSRFTRACVLGWAAITPERVLVLPNTVRAAFAPGDGSIVQAAWGLQGKRVLLTVGRIDLRERYKGHDLVINAIPQLVAAGHDVVYLIVGGGDDQNRLEALARQAGIADRVRFLGAVQLSELIEIYRAADLFVMPSTGEGFGIAFLEAMASGTPAIGLGVAGTNDALADGELGMLVPESSLVTALMRALEREIPEPHQLAAATRARFGREPFSACACGVIERLSEAV
jgi:phosphatidylinositol alpha-1,6-mannosyltransferase